MDLQGQSYCASDEGDLGTVTVEMCSDIDKQNNDCGLSVGDFFPQTTTLLSICVRMGK